MNSNPGYQKKRRFGARHARVPKETQHIKIVDRLGHEAWIRTDGERLVIDET